MKKALPFLPIIVVIALVLCCCLILILSGAYYSILRFEKILPTISAYLPLASNGPTPTPFEITRQPADQIPTETLKLLEMTLIPDNDLAKQACQFRSVCDVPTTLAPPSEPFSIGAHQAFWVNDEDTHSYFQVQATLRYVTPHAYFWIEDNVRFKDQAVKNLVDAFENKIYPTDRQFFGSEWTPGVDDDPHIYILYTGGLGADCRWIFLFAG